MSTTKDWKISGTVTIHFALAKNTLEMSDNGVVAGKLNQAHHDMNTERYMTTQRFDFDLRFKDTLNGSFNYRQDHSAKSDMIVIA